MEVRLFNSEAPEYKAALELRYRILREPLGLTFSEEDISNEAGQIHLGLFDGDRIAGSLTLVDSNNGTLKMRQLAIDTPYQGKGYSYMLMEAGEQYAKGKGYSRVYGHARKAVVPLYLKMGYTTMGEEFEEVGIPHLAIEKLL